MAHSDPKLRGKEVWQKLMEGNQRFVQGAPLARNLPELRRHLLKGQHPGAAVLCCSDSRTPAEIIFDQSLGDLFVVRSAGLVLEPTTLGSLEYAVAHLHVPLLVILGHEFCGAVTVAVEHPEPEEGNIGAIVKQIAPAVRLAHQSGKMVKEELVEIATETFLSLITDSLKRKNPVISKALHAQRLELVTAKYFLTTGQVEMLASTF
jgi:carbonic anhydrase